MFKEKEIMMFKETDIDDFMKSMKLELTRYDKGKINTVPIKELLRKIKDSYKIFMEYYVKGYHEACYQKLIELTLKSIILLSRTEVLLRLESIHDNLFRVLENETIVFPIDGTIEEKIVDVLYKDSEYYLPMQICKHDKEIYMGIVKSILPN